jgi:hypothetical protein
MILPVSSRPPVIEEWWCSLGLSRSSWVTGRNRWGEGPMRETLTTTEYAAWLAVMVERPRMALAASAGDSEDRRPDLVPCPAHRTLYVRRAEGCPRREDRRPPP